MRNAESPSPERFRLDYVTFREALRSGPGGDKAADVFREIIRRFYADWGRDLPWRRTRDPYRILVSEFMLQQTQVQRVMAKYGAFLRSFPDLEALSEAPLSSVLAAWQGLGYNRRAKALHDTASKVMSEFGGEVPAREDQLVSLPGVGKATAGAVGAFAFGLPTVFVETNIRRVYLHFFHPRSERVTDGELVAEVGRTLDTSDPRHWYYALMDYGSYLGTKISNPNRRSAHYRRQSPFEGSDRQVRSAVIRLLLREGPLPEGKISNIIGAGKDRTGRLIDALVHEGFVLRRRGKCSIP